MKQWSLLLCEGPHDMRFLECLARINSEWETVDANDSPASSLKGAMYLHLINVKEQVLVLASMGGISNIIPERPSGWRVDDTAGLKLVAKHAKSASSIGVILDADDAGISDREHAVRAHYGRVLTAAVGVAHGTVVPPSGQERGFGLWVAHNAGENVGSLDWSIARAISEIHPHTFPLAIDFVEKLGKQQPKDWGTYQLKAQMGAFCQLWQAGGSLASAINAERDQIVSAKTAAKVPYISILNFMNSLAN